MAYKIEKETSGAWIVHHGRKVALDANGASEFPVLDEAAKSAGLLVRLGASDASSLPMTEVTAIAKAARLNPRLELPALLQGLQAKRLLEVKGETVEVLGVTTRAALGHAADIFNDAGPSKFETAAIDLAEKTSLAPAPKKEMQEYIGDLHKMKTQEAADFLSRSEEIGFVDAEGDGSDRLLFNGNLFRRESIQKTKKVLDSLSSADQRKMQEFDALLKVQGGCINATVADKVFGQPLFEKMLAAGVYDLNTVSNDQGEHVFVTSPGSFHKFTNPMVDDSFDMAKALVAALTYGMTLRQSSQGRIFSIEKLLGALIAGRSVGPATAIGMDYRVLEENRVVKLTPSGNAYGGFYMRLLKREVGELALQVLTTGSAAATVLDVPPQAAMSGYLGPEVGRTRVRVRQSKPSKQATQDILAAIRGGKAIT
jgi:hypothetical protein